jgi:hypothetical protein
MVYVHLTEFEEDGFFIVKVAGDLNEFVGLIESGFEFISDYDGKKVCRKRK